MRKACIETIYRLAKADRRVIFIGSDVGVTETFDRFKKEMPDQFLMEGVSEAHIVGMATGLALSGRIPYINTIATFLTRRCFENIVLDAALHNADIRLIGNGGGLVYAPLGPTHLAIDDLAILRAIPRMTVIAPADAEEMARLTARTIDYRGPVYLRVAKGGEPIVTSPSMPCVIGKAVPMREGGDALIVSTGVMLKAALDAADRLRQRAVATAVLHVHTVKPIDREAIIGHAGPVRAIVSVEEHSVIGGLGSAVAETVAEASFDQPKKFLRIGIPDVFPDRYGSQTSLLERYGMTTDNIVGTIERLLTSFGGRDNA